MPEIASPNSNTSRDGTARSNEKLCLSMRAAPDGFHRLGKSRVGCPQLPELLNKKSNYRRSLPRS